MQKPIMDSKYHLIIPGVAMLSTTVPLRNTSHFFAFMVNHCTLQQWKTNSAIVMTTADAPHGPYDVTNYKTIVPPWSHNPYITTHNNQYMIWHIGNGKTNGVVNCTNGTAHKRQSHVDTNSSLYVEVSNHSLYGPWTQLDQNTQIVIDETWENDPSNPAPFIFPN
eukprot:518576_1